jgi:site-specific recombinase XerD
VNDLLKRYCRKAGIQEKYGHAHTLRHSSAMLRIKTGQPVEKVQRHLGHENIATTQIYIQHALDHDPDEGWAAVDALLGLSKSTVPTPKKKR